MDSKTTKDIFVKDSYPKNREEFKVWFRQNYFKLKLSEDFKSCCRTYFKSLTAEERENDVFLENVKYSRKLENFGNSEKQWKPIISKQLMCMKHEIEKFFKNFRYRYKDQVKSIKDAFSVTLLNLQKSADLNTSDSKKTLQYFEKELNLILDEKWAIEFFEGSKRALLSTFNEEWKKNVDGMSMNENSALAKERTRERSMNNEISNASSTMDGVFKKPDMPVKTKRNASNNANISGASSQEALENNLGSSSKIIKQKDEQMSSSRNTGPNSFEYRDSCGNQDNLIVRNSDSLKKSSNDFKDLMIKKEHESDKNDIDMRKQSENKYNLHEFKGRMQNDLSKISEASEPSFSSSIESHKYDHVLSSITIMKENVNCNDLSINFEDFKRRKPIAESTSINKPSISQPRKQAINHLDVTLKQEDLIGSKPIAQSTSIPNLAELQPNQLQKSISKEELYKIQLFSQSKAISEQNSIPSKSEEDKFSEAIKDFGTMRSFVPSMTEQIESQHSLSNESIKEEELYKVIPIAQSTSIDKQNPNPVKHRSNILDDETIGDFFKKQPIAQSTSIDKQNPNLVKHRSNILDDGTIGDFFKKQPIAQSTTKIPKPNTKPTNNDSFTSTLSTKEKLNVPGAPSLDSKSNNSSMSQANYQTGKENIPISKDSQENKKTDIHNLSSILDNVKNEFLNSELQVDNSLNRTIFFVTESVSLVNTNFPILQCSPWNENIRNKWWEDILPNLIGDDNVLVVDENIHMGNKITFKIDNVDQDFYFNSKNKFKIDKFVEVYLVKSFINKDYVVKVLNSKECMEYYIVKYIRTLLKKRSMTVDVSLSICDMFCLKLSTSKSCILMPFYQIGTLLDLSGLIKRENIKMQETELLAAYVAIELLTTMLWLHSTARILHCDIKPDNIMLNDYFPNLETQFRLKKTQVVTIIDFGKSIFLQKFESHCAFITRSSPKGLECVEMVANKPWRYQIDLFNIATSLYVLFQNKYPKVIQKSDRPVFSSFNNFRNLRAGAMWLNLFDDLINVETISYPNIRIYINGLTDLINANLVEYNNAAGKINLLLAHIR